ncbi:MAG: aminotransferase class IV, partial [Firmicutes bacterium]|nr:aminotransferase class IV [Bacillota bacterium]
MARYVYLNGQILPEDQAHLSVFDHGFLYGDGVFEGIRAYNGRIFELESHLKRLYESAQSLLLPIPLSFDEMAEATAETVRANGLLDAYIRLVVSRGPGDLGLNPLHCPQATVVIIADQVALYPQHVYDNGMVLASTSMRRPAGDVLNPSIKSLNYLNSILAKIEANQRGVSEVVLLNQQGHVVEGTGDNIFIIKDNVLQTPAAHAG